MRNFCFAFTLLFFVSCTYDVHTSSKQSSSSDTVTVVQNISTLDTASIRTGKPTYNKQSTRKTDYYINGVLVKHEETTSTPDSRANRNSETVTTSSSVQHTAFFDDDVQVRKSAVSQLKNQSDIKHVALFDNDVEVRKLAVTMLENETDLQHVAFFDNDDNIRLLAVSMLKNQINIRHAAFFDKETKVRKLALTKLVNRADIQHVASFDKDDSIKKLAEKLLNKK